MLYFIVHNMNENSGSIKEEEEEEEERDFFPSSSWKRRDEKCSIVYRQAFIETTRHSASFPLLPPASLSCTDHERERKHRYTIDR